MSAIQFPHNIFYKIDSSQYHRTFKTNSNYNLANFPINFSGHAESYNPPPEYLFDEKEMKEWHKYKDEPQRRKLHFMPQRYNSLREVPAYSRYIRERFLRCLDLYLCPRAKRMKVMFGFEFLILPF